MSATRNGKERNNAIHLAIFAIPLATILIFAGRAYCANSCSRECSADYRADVCTCQELGADDLGGNNRACVQEANDDYDTCLHDCWDPLSLSLIHEAEEPKAD